MSRFADPRATRTVDLGPCECPGTPHEADAAIVRAEFSAADVTALAATPTDDEGTIATVVAPFVLEWNLLGVDGEPWPPSSESLLALKPPTLNAIVTAIIDGIAASSTVPNASSALSPASPRESASRTRTSTLTPGTSS